MFKVPALSVLCGAMLMAFGPVHAACSIDTFFDRTASFGAAADAHSGCGPAVNGGGNITASKNYDNNAQGSHTRATADLGTGTLTAWAGTSTSGSSLYAASTLWDTFTFNGLPSGGATLVSTLFLNGSMTGAAAVGDVIFTQGSTGSVAKQFNFTAATGVPASVSFSFTAFNGVPIKLGVELEAYLSGPGAAIADLEDPPTFSVVVPTGATFTSASGVFSNVGPSPVPEMPTMLLTLAGLGLVAGAARVPRRGGC